MLTKKLLNHNEVKLWFGKHKGKTLYQVAIDAPQYIFWLNDNKVLVINNLLLDIANHNLVRKKANRTKPNIVVHDHTIRNQVNKRHKPIKRRR